MAFSIVKVHKEHFPALRLIGKRYTDNDRVNGAFGAKWDEWGRQDWFEKLDALNPSFEVESGPLGLMTIGAKNHDNFTYWIGLLFPPETDAPDGFDKLDLPESDVGVTWIYGSCANGEIFGEAPHTASYNKIQEHEPGPLNENAGGDGVLVFFERYSPMRFDNPDEKGNVILDYGFYIQ
ncbi:MAG: hypothetical protein LBS62_03660 [Clostridiales bacterium]|jgi:hypothetical protein|nr:hypothetical protein [Clostridiales bacterium]